MKRYIISPKMRQRAVQLRQNQTEAEARLWSHLRSHRMANVHFRRQHNIGNYIVDFCAPRKKIIVEVDGGQHLEQQEYDAQRTLFLEECGYRVLRFWNSDVMKNIDSVLDEIYRVLKEI